MPVLIPNRYSDYRSKSLPPNIIMAEKEIRDVLERADRNGDGCLSKDELKKAFKEFGSMIPGLRAFFFLRKADANKDGYLCGEELDAVVDFVLARYKKYK